MSDIIRLAKSIYGNDYGRMAKQAGDIKASYIQQGGDPQDVYSPERLEVLANGGPLALLAESSRMREDGSVAAPYVPTPLALATNIIEPGARPAVKEAMSQGVNTVSSGIDKRSGRGFAIGQDPNGGIVKVLR